MARPQPLLTQPKAACWMAEADLHWHSKSVVAQLTPLAAEKMHDSAHLGTVSALFWQGWEGVQAGPLVMVPVALVVVSWLPEDEVSALDDDFVLEVVLVAWPEQGVVGLAETQSHRAETD